MKRIRTSVRVNIEMAENASYDLEGKLKHDLMRSFFSEASNICSLEIQESQCYDKNFKEFTIDAVVAKQSEINELLYIITSAMNLSKMSNNSETLMHLLQTARNIITE